MANGVPRLAEKETKQPVTAAAPSSYRFAALIADLSALIRVAGVGAARDVVAEIQWRGITFASLLVT
ncbi:hypothetical protein FDECE_12335 [Fusarium decemcellulare]|nr:hypothetical protein FDECE_12335 [Fusarium decemcellulare]